MQPQHGLPSLPLTPCPRCIEWHHRSLFKAIRVLCITIYTCLPWSFLLRSLQEQYVLFKYINQCLLNSRFSKERQNLGRCKRGVILWVMSRDDSCVLSFSEIFQYDANSNIYCGEWELWKWGGCGTVKYSISPSASLSLSLHVAFQINGSYLLLLSIKGRNKCD